MPPSARRAFPLFGARCHLFRTANDTPTRRRGAGAVVDNRLPVQQLASGCVSATRLPLPLALARAGWATGANVPEGCRGARLFR